MLCSKPCVWPWGWENKRRWINYDLSLWGSYHIPVEKSDMGVGAGEIIHRVHKVFTVLWPLVWRSQLPLRWSWVDPMEFCLSPPIFLCVQLTLHLLRLCLYSGPYGLAVWCTILSPASRIPVFFLGGCFQIWYSWLSWASVLQGGIPTRHFFPVGPMKVPFLQASQGLKPIALLPAGCIQEPSFCQLVEIKDSAPLYFTCTLYPEAQVCDDVMESNPKGCRLILPHRPKTLFRKKGECLVGSAQTAFPVGSWLCGFRNIQISLFFFLKLKLLMILVAMWNHLETHEADDRE